MEQPLAVSVEAQGGKGHCVYARRRFLQHLSLLLVSVGLGALLVWSLGGDPFKSFACTYAGEAWPVANGSQKGICMDLTTWNDCPGNIPSHFPHTNEPIKMVRLFQPESYDTEQSWKSLRAFLQHTGGQALVAAPVSCNSTYDYEMWVKVIGLLRYLGRGSVMALAVGNEIDQIDTKMCDIWGHFESWWKKAIEDLSALEDGQWSTLPVTTVMTAGVLASSDNTWTPQSMYIKDGTEYGQKGPNIEAAFAKIVSVVAVSRFFFTFNIYPYFVPCSPAGPCTEAFKSNAICFHDPDACNTPRTTAGARYALRKFAAKHVPGKPEMRMWIGELGWSSPQGATLNDNQCRAWGTKMCDNWSSTSMLLGYYKNFLSWDLSIGEGLAPPERVFYFTIRDSFNNGKAEHFGLCGLPPKSQVDLQQSCADPTMKH